MKALLCIFVIFIAPQMARAEAQIQIFFNYRGPSQYDYKIYSTPEEPDSAYYLMQYAIDGTPNAACFTGPGREALTLLKTMVAIYNAEYNRQLSMRGYVFYDDDGDNAALHLDLIAEDGSSYEWFARLRACAR